MLNSCDGILCFHGSSHAWLYNPATNEYRLLPPGMNSITLIINNSSIVSTPILNSRCECHLHPGCGWGFGRDLVTKRYKIVRLFKPCLNRTGPEHQHPGFCSVFTLDPNPNAGWKTIGEMPYKINATDSVYVNGAIYWFNSAEVIIMFDLYTEKFEAMPLPSSCSNELPIQRSMQLGTLRECLCLAERELDSQFLNIWIMEKQQQKITWEKLYCITFLRDYLWQIAGRIAFAEQKDGTLLVCTEDDVCRFKQNIEIPCMSHRFVTPKFDDSLVDSYFSNMNEAKCEPTVFTETLVPLYGRTMSQFKSLPETTAYFESPIYVVKPEAF